ncbi:MAG: hypothetical protein ACRD1F_02835 [Terriglobales bacterium]
MATILAERALELATSAAAIAFSTGIAFLALRLLCRGIEQKLRSHT